MLKFQKLDKRMNWHSIYSYRVEFGHPAFISETDNNENSHISNKSQLIFTSATH